MHYSSVELTLCTIYVRICVCARTAGRYTELFTRIYKVMLEPPFNAEDAARNISDDWQSDAKGQAKLYRTAFGDALFEMADM